MEGGSENTKPKILEGGFFGGECKYKCKNTKGVLVPPTQYAHKIFFAPAKLPNSFFLI